MSTTWTLCVSCGGALSIPASATKMRVCGECRTLMERYNEEILDRGKLPDLIFTSTALGVGKRGSYKGKPFQLMGRAQLEQNTGSVWDEWYAGFEDSPWGWLAEAQGKLYLTFEEKTESAKEEIPGFDELEVGKQYLLPGSKRPLTVTEKNVAKVRSAEGELPWVYTPNENYKYADLTGPNGVFATIDYRKEEPTLFIGEEIQYSDFEDAETKPTREAEVLTLPCPSCNNELSIHVPRRTVRVGCPNCSTLLTFGNDILKEIGTAFTKKTTGKKGKKKHHHKPKLQIPIGSVGRFNAGEMTVVGYLQKSTYHEGKNYYWDEYLLHSPDLGFRWLVQSDHHWSFVNEIQAGDVKGYHARAEYEGHNFARFQGGKATVKTVVGEIFWKVQPGDDTRTADYIKPPFMLSKETTKTGSKTSEVHWSLGKYLSVSEVEKAFDLRNLPRPTTIGPHQPFPHRHIYKYWLLFTCVAVLLWIAFTIMAKNRAVAIGEREHQREFILPKNKSTESFTSKTFQLKGGENIHVSAEISLTKEGGTLPLWTLVNGQLVNQKTTKLTPFGMAMGKNDRLQSVYLSSVPAGEYQLTLNMDRQASTSATKVTIRVKQDVPNPGLGGWLLFFLAIPPVAVGLYHLYFMSQRWENAGG